MASVVPLPELYSFLPSREHRCPVAGTKLYCSVTEALVYVCEQLAESGYVAAERPGVELATS